MLGLCAAMPAFAQAQPAAPPALVPPPATAPPPAAEGSAVTPTPAPEPVVEAQPSADDEREANNAVYIELLGASLIYSINYDRRFGDFAARAGLMYFAVGASAGADASASVSLLGIPLSATYVGLGSKKHSFEVGGGVTIYHASGSSNTLGVKSDGSATTALGHLILGYRLQPVDGGFFLRAGVSPVIGSGVFLPWPHVGLGATF